MLAGLSMEVSLLFVVFWMGKLYNLVMDDFALKGQNT